MSAGTAFTNKYLADQPTNQPTNYLKGNAVHPTVAVFSASVANVRKRRTHAGCDSVFGDGHVVQGVLHAKGLNGADHGGGSDAKGFVEFASFGCINNLGNGNGSLFDGDAPFAAEGEDGVG